MSAETTWLYLPGGFSEALVASSALKLAHDRLGKKYNVIRRAAAAELLAGHPGVARIDYLPEGASVLNAAVPDGEDRGAAFRRLAGLLGVAAPAEGKPYLPLDGVSDALPAAQVPWRAKNVAIAPGGPDRLKELPADGWALVARRLEERGALTVQLGKKGAEKIKHSYSLAGVTTAGQAVMLLKRMDLLIGADSFLTHAAAITGTPVVRVPEAGTAAGLAELALAALGAAPRAQGGL